MKHCGNKNNRGRLSRTSQGVSSNSKVVTTESEFLSDYSIEDYERPSVATDIVVFSMWGEEAESHRKDAEPRLSMLLIKRGEHPFLNKWALPGGFLRRNETVEECAYRELTEETNVKPVSLVPIGVFSEPNRDPRGWIVSNAFMSIVGEESVEIIGGDDATDAKWFDVNFGLNGENIFKFTLKNDSECISVVLEQQEERYGKKVFRVIENTGLAFDHAEIVATALYILRSEAEDVDIAFDFLSEKFTLTELQKVQETLLGSTLLTANFRRKISGIVEETDEYTEGAGHRPARLFKRKK